MTDWLKRRQLEMLSSDNCDAPGGYTEIEISITDEHLQERCFKPTGSHMMRSQMLIVEGYGGGRRVDQGAGVEERKDKSMTLLFFCAASRRTPGFWTSKNTFVGTSAGTLWDAGDNAGTLVDAGGDNAGTLSLAFLRCFLRRFAFPRCLHLRSLAARRSFIKLEHF